MNTISLWDCAHARIGRHLKTYAGNVHAIECGRYGEVPTLNTLSIQKGKPLRVKECQGCPRFDPIGEPLPERLKGMTRNDAEHDEVSGRDAPGVRPAPGL